MKHHCIWNESTSNSLYTWSKYWPINRNRMWRGAHKSTIQLERVKNDNFNKIDEMLMKFYYLYEKSPKCLQELKCIADTWVKSVPKPSKSYGTLWIDHKVTSVKIMLENYGAYISYVELLSQTDLQALKRVELKGYLLKWKDPSIQISLAIY